jgi:hypothetical protein
LPQDTPFNKRCEILADLWTNYRNDEQFVDFVKYNDLALPFAYAIANDFVDVSSAKAFVPFIDEGWNLLLAGIGVDDDNFDNLDELLRIG